MPLNAPQVELSLIFNAVVTFGHYHSHPVFLNLTPLRRRFWDASQFEGGSSRLIFCCVPFAPIQPKLASLRPHLHVFVALLALERARRELVRKKPNRCSLSSQQPPCFCAETPEICGSANDSEHKSAGIPLRDEH